jgi:hypothetical protein
MIIDRGCEGQLISYWDTIPSYIRKIRQMAENVSEVIVEESKFDAPPSPAI